MINIELNKISKGEKKMKKTFVFFLSLVFMLTMSTIAFAQNAPIDFETGGYGADWTWTVFENDTNPPVEIIANPDASDPNTSATVAKFTALETGQPWAGCETLHGSDIGTFNLDETNCTIKIMVYKPVISDVGIKLVKPDGWSMGEIKVANTVVNEWEELTFSFSSQLSDGYDQIVIFPDFDLAGRTQDNICYFDNITFSEQIIPQGPSEAAPTPTDPADSTISLFSNAYTDVTVDTWSADWDDANVEDVQIEGNDTKLYTNLVFAGIEFTSQTIDATDMNYFHMDIWTPDSTVAPAVFKIKLVDFGADGAWGGGDDVEHELTFDENSIPPLESETWVSFHIPMTDFTNLTTTGHLAQLIISADPNTVYMDNVYFTACGSTPTEPTVAAPTPVEPQDSVISLFSNAYTDVPVDTWSAGWDQADLEDIQINGNDTKLYTNLVFAGIEFTAQTIDATDMNYFHMDVWTPDPTAAPAVFKIKLVDFGADGVWGGGDDVEHELVLDETTMDTGSWVNLVIPMSDFTNLTTTGHLAQLIISADPNTVYVDNVYFSTCTGAPTEPHVAAPTPTEPPDSVISLFSNAYTDVTVDTWSAGWDDADVEDIQIEGNDTKLYTNLVFAGIEFTSQTIDATEMNYFHMDIWTPDPTASPAVCKIKLVDFGADGVWGGGDDVESELTFDESTLSTGTWVSLNIPMSDFIDTGLTTTGHLAQLIISGDLSTVYIDNVYFSSISTSVDETNEYSGFNLKNNYPNPFKPQTTISFSLIRPSNVSIKIYNLKGQLVKTLADGEFTSANHSIVWNGTDNSGRKVSEGVYFYKMQAPRFSSTKKMILMK